MSTTPQSGFNAANADQVRNKLTQVFRYLQALDQLRNPVRRNILEQPWVFWWRDLPQHPTVRRGEILPPARGDEEPAEGEADPSGDDFILKVRRPDVTRAPEPPESLMEWLEPGWETVTGPVRVKPAVTQLAPDGTPRVINFTDEPERSTELSKYTTQWESWAEAERPARAALAFFERLYALYAQLQREGESYELVVGDGLLAWGRQEGAVRHPILLQRVQLSFEPSVPEFTLTDTLQPPELYSALFRAMPDVNAIEVGHSRTELEQGGWHPLGGAETDEFLRKLIVRVNVHGRFIGKSEPQAVKEYPQIGRTPVLFLRRRTLGFGAALEAVLEQLPARTDLPPALARVVGIDTGPLDPSETLGTPSFADSPNGEDEQVLLSKPANPEQLQIAIRLDKHGAVLVQGPPGTGKTHTIGNLIGHLLAQGKSILVTSHTAKALKVLRDQVVEPLRPLCVSVLDESTHQLESAIDTITERLSDLNADQLDREASQLQQSRIRILDELRKARSGLQHARQDEIHPIVVAGEEYRPPVAARWVAEHESELGWIPGPLTPGAMLPLTAGELVELYGTNVVVTDADEAELGWTLPDPVELVTPTEFGQAVQELRALTTGGALDYRAELWREVPETSSGADLRNLLHSLKKGIEPLVTAPRWWLAAAIAGIEGRERREPWEDLIAQIEAVYSTATAAENMLLQYGPEVPEACLAGKAGSVVEAILDHLKSGGQLNWWTLVRHGEWKAFLAQARVNGQAPEKVEHFEALRAYLEVQTFRSDLLRRWQRQMTLLGAPEPTSLGNRPEDACRQYIASIRTALDWRQGTWVPLQQAFIDQGFRWDIFLAEISPSLAEFGEILRLREAVAERLPAVLDAEIARRRQRWWRQQFEELNRRLDLVGKTASEVVHRLRNAVRQQDSDEYAAAFERLVDLRRRGAALLRRQKLLAKLELVAPAWATQIRRREGIHGGRDLPGNPAEAWLWRQLEGEIGRRTRASMEELQSRVEHLSAELREVTAQLVERRSWAAQVRRTSLPQRMALGGWKKIMSKIGKGTGKRVPRLAAEARRLMPECQTAVPVWIMPLNRVVENYDPRRTRFDVVIIDEASQADLMALIAVFMAKQVVVVGDHEQVSPLAVGQRADEVQHLIDEHLDGIPNAVLYDGRYSIYDVAQTAFEPICLREHFRCVQPIIEFSNHLSYGGKILPLRDASDVNRRPHTVSYRVEALTTYGNVNEDEALAVASLMVAATEQKEYRQATFGAISMVGDEQARRIDTLLQRFMSPEEYQRRRVQVGNSAEFQGDERDVIFLSMVDTPTGTGPLSLRSDGPENMYKKRFNVAASRARDQLWVVYSMNPETDLQPGDLRRKLIEHAKDPMSLVRRLERAEAQTESEFERLVIRRLIQAGYRVTAQRAVGAYRIDMVVEGGGRQLAVECDGERYHTPDKLAEDVARQAVLERMGWRFHRIRGSEFFRNPDKTMDRLFARLTSLGVTLEGDGGGEVGADGHELLDRIKRRAEELRQQWIDDGDIPEAPRARRRFGRKPEDKSRAPGGAAPDTGYGPTPKSPSALPQEQLSLPLGDNLAEPESSTASSSPIREPQGRPAASGPKVDLGSTVILEDLSTHERLSFTLAQAHKGDLAKGLISLDSPVGRAIIGRCEGERVYVATPGGVDEYILLSVQQ